MITVDQNLINQMSEYEAAQNKNDLTCDYCNKKFNSDRAIMIHVCEPRRRFNNRMEEETLVAYSCYVSFMDHITTSANMKTPKSFLYSLTYLSFIKLAKYLIIVDCHDHRSYIDFLVKGKYKEIEWMKDTVYTRWILQYNEIEYSLDAFERAMKTMIDWSENKNVKWVDFFNHVSPSDLEHYIRLGKITPWILFTDHGNKLFDRLTENQMDSLKLFFSPYRWKNILNQKVSEFKTIKSILGE